jgi:hypothetical protein
MKKATRRRISGEHHENFPPRNVPPRRVTCDRSKDRNIYICPANKARRRIRTKAFAIEPMTVRAGAGVCSLAGGASSAIAGVTPGVAVKGRFCCRSRLSFPANSDSVALTLTLAGADDDGVAEPGPRTVSLLLPAERWGKISRFKSEFCGRLHCGPTVKRLAGFLRCKMSLMAGAAFVARTDLVAIGGKADATGSRANDAIDPSATWRPRQG